MTSSEAAGNWDVVVIGGGHNGLVAAAVLAKTGRKVLVLEAAGEVGGAARTETFAPGFRVSSLAHILNRLHPDVVAALDLERHGLAIDRNGGAPTTVLSRQGDTLVLNGAYGESLDGATAAEAVAWRELRAQLLRYAGVLKPFLSRAAPDFAGMPLTETAALARTGLALRRLGKEDMRDFLRMLLMNVTDALDEHLTDDRLRGLLAFDAVLGSHLGPRSPTSLLGLYYRLTGEAGGTSGAQLLPKGGMGAVVKAVASAAAAAGVTARVGSPVAKIRVEKGRAAGVTLQSGEEIRTKTVMSAINPRTTLLELVGPRMLDTGLVRKVSNIRMDGNVAKLNLALDKVPRFAGVDDAAARGRMVVARSADHVENAFNPSKYGAFSPEPVMEIILPSLSDPSLAPGGACVLSAVIQYSPYRLKEGWEAGKPKLLDAVLTEIEAHAPGLRQSVLHAELLTPDDIEARYRMPGGHWHHGELQADQMLMSRPVSGLGRYDTPIDGLFLCGAGSHPGGGVSGAPGLNAARRVVQAGG
ncbi:phytoene desaturase family protein [Mesorhizobium sp. L-8-3]|uniref:phytoene desaturase family protein n=1 Tax=Mesorhizobium sp. L-8-3 TaxID=2744522 RepID=UPI001926C65E|nr:NAD(P)/FAD-dependent oxidoreductase [Mesorhizobium sp. L-8-3]